MPPQFTGPLLSIFQQQLRVPLHAENTLDLATALNLDLLQYLAPYNQASTLLQMAPQPQYNFGLTHGPNSRLFIRLIPWGIADTHQSGVAVITALPPYVDRLNYTELGSTLVGKIFYPEQITLNVNAVSAARLQDIETNLLAHIILTYRCFSILLPGENFFILPRRAMVSYSGAAQAHCETFFELRLCKTYQLNGSNPPIYTDNINQVNTLRTGLGITIDRPTRIINFNGRIMALSHPSGITHPGANSTRPPSQLQHNQPFWILRGVQPNLPPPENHPYNPHT